MGGNRLLASLISGSALPIKKHGISGLVSSGNGGSGYDSGLGSDGNWTTVSNLTTDNAVTSPSGLGAKSWLSNGSSTIISLSAGQIFPVNSDITFVTWIYSTSIETQNVITSDADYYFTVYLAGGGAALEYIVKDGDGNNSGGEASFSFQADTWYMLACTFNATAGTTVSYVFDTSDDSKTTVKTTTNSSCNTVATHTAWKMMYNGTETFNGRILSPAIWNVILSSSELDDLFNSGDAATPDTVQKDKIVCYWDSQTGSAPIVNLAIP